MALMSTVSCTDLPYLEARMVKKLDLLINSPPGVVPPPRSQTKGISSGGSASKQSKEHHSWAVGYWQELGEDVVEVLVGWLSCCELIHQVEV